MDLDAPVRPIDPQDDASRRAAVRTAGHRHRRELLLMLATGAGAVVGGTALGVLHGDAPFVGAFAMLVAWAATQAITTAFGLLGALLGLPALLRYRLPSRPDAPVPPPLAGLHPWVLTVYGLAFTVLGALAGLVTSVASGAGPRWAALASFGVLGLVLGALARWFPR